MISDATFYFLVADQKKALIKVKLYQFLSWKISMFFLMQRADLSNACNLKNLKRADAERAVDKAKERLAKVFGIKVGKL